MEPSPSGNARAFREAQRPGREVQVDILMTPISSLGPSEVTWANFFHDEQTEETRVRSVRARNVWKERYGHPW